VQAGSDTSHSETRVKDDPGIGEPGTAAPRSLPAKLLGTAGLKLKVAGICTGVLIVGALLAPRGSSTALSPLEMRPAPLILQQVDPPVDDQSFRGIQSVAPRVRDHSVAMPRSAPPPARPLWDYAQPMTGLPMPAGFGVLVNAQGHVLTHAAALEGRAMLNVQTASGATVQAMLLAFEPHTGLALLRISSSPGLVVPPITTTRAAAGTLVAAVASSAGRDFATPVFLSSAGTDAYAIAAMESSVLPGTPLYDLDGALLAVVGDTGPARMAFPAADAVARLTALAARGTELQGSLGFAVQPIDADLAAVFGSGGVLISDVVAGGPADRAGVNAGDVLLAIGEVDVRSGEDVWRAMSAVPQGTMTMLRMTRASRPRRLSVTAVSAFDVATLARNAPTGLASYPSARTLLTPAQLEASRVPSDARVLHVNSRAVTTPAEFDREVRRTARPAVLYVVLDGQRFFVMLPRQP
jgi:S1-C subfamily serine protease